ncbi:aldose 1-epimerase [Sarracenia purpurea var. burkii]
MQKSCVLLCFIILACWVVVKSSESKLDVGIYELKTGDFSVKLTNWGATILSFLVPDKYGKSADVVLGYDSVKNYMNDTTYFGATVGRVANRIGGARFTLNGILYKLDANDGKNTLHGGPKGFSDVVWKVKKYHNKGHSPYITFSYHSFDGEEGFPGDLLVTVTYTLFRQSVALTMEAKALNKATPVNLAHHSYWNLGGQNSGDILANEIQIFGSHITHVDKDLIPTGNIATVKGTPYDFLHPTTIESKIKQLPNGYDINYVLDGHTRELKTAAIVYDKRSGRVMEVLTNQPGLQFYTGNHIKDVKGKDGFVYEAHAGLCLETQGFPDSVNHPNFPSQIVTPGKMYVHRMLFKFSTKAA